MYKRDISSKEIRWQKRLEAQARTHRDNPTSAEALLWDKLRNRQLGYRFRRQFPLFQYICDLYCKELRLVIEVDGSIHAITQEHDELRDKLLLERGYTTLRFSNEDVVHDINNVLKRIMQYISTSPNRGK